VLLRQAQRSSDNEHTVSFDVRHSRFCKGIKKGSLTLTLASMSSSTSAFPLPFNPPATAFPLIALTIPSALWFPTLLRTVLFGLATIGSEEGGAGLDELASRKTGTWRTGFVRAAKWSLGAGLDSMRFQREGTYQCWLRHVKNGRGGSSRLTGDGDSILDFLRSLCKVEGVDRVLTVDDGRRARWGQRRERKIGETEGNR
jgi:hypothetical protein